MEAIKVMNQDAHKWLLKLPVNCRSRHAFDGRIKCEHITNNMTESFNSWLGRLRAKLMLIMLELIRSKLMSRLQMRYKAALQWNGKITLNVKKELDVTLYNSR